MRPFHRLAAIVGLASGLTGCASYRPLELPTRSSLAPRLSFLDLQAPPPKPLGAPVRLNPKKPLSPDQIGLLAILNNPDLVATRGNVAIAEAQKLAATLLPNPSGTLSTAFLISGPGTADAMTASLSQDIQSIVVYRPKVAAAEAHVDEVKANVLWQEWQIAQKARLLAVGIYWGEREIRLREHALTQLTAELAEVKAAIAAGNLTFAAEAPLLAANATAERDLAAARLTLLKNRQALDALLGLKPAVRFPISAPPPFAIPHNLDALIASLPARRPDLVALQLGYAVADSNVRVAILSQFPAFSVGLGGGSDTSQVVSLGPQVTFDLPIFNHNQAKVAATEATRAELQAQYQARLDAAEGTARSLVAQSRAITAELAKARKQSAAAGTLLQSAEHAYRQGNLSQRDLTDYQTTALQRKLSVAGYQKTLEENALALAVELGLGLPKVTLAPPQEGATLL